jgi:DNA (cytosine-5)-methyltransferase 1
LENVPGHLSLGFGRVLGDLADLGFDADWECVPAAAVGAPHLRYRVFVVAHADGGRLEERGERYGGTAARVESSLGNDARRLRADVADADGERLEGTESKRVRVCERSERGDAGRRRDAWWATEPDVGRVAHGVPARVDRLRCLGNAVVPQVAEWIGRRIVAADNARTV